MKPLINETKNIILIKPDILLAAWIYHELKNARTKIKTTSRFGKSLKSRSKNSFSRRKAPVI